MPLPGGQDEVSESSNLEPNMIIGEALAIVEGEGYSLSTRSRGTGSINN